jgi:hypothetical protein
VLRDRLADTDTRASRTRAVLGQGERTDEVLSITNRG